MEGKQSALDVAKIEASSRQNETGTHLEHREGCQLLMADASSDGEQGALTRGRLSEKLNWRITFLVGLIHLVRHAIRAQPL